MTATRQDIARRLFLAGEDLSEHAIASMRRAAKSGGVLSVADVAKFATLDLARQALARQFEEFFDSGVSLTPAHHDPRLAVSWMAWLGPDARSPQARPGPRSTAPAVIRRDHWLGYSLTVALDRAGILEDIQHHEAEAARLRGLWG